MNKIYYVISSSTMKAPDMTHSLSVLGDGNMGAGIRVLWYSGIATGVISCCVAHGAFKLVQYGAQKLVYTYYALQCKKVYKKPVVESSSSIDKSEGNTMPTSDVTNGEATFICK